LKCLRIRSNILNGQRIKKIIYTREQAKRKESKDDGKRGIEKANIKNGRRTISTVY